MRTSRPRSALSPSPPSLGQDDQTRLRFGTVAPLDPWSTPTVRVTADKQALIAVTVQPRVSAAHHQASHRPQSERSPAFANRTGDSTPDRVGLDRLPEEDMVIEDLVRQAYANNPQIEQAILNMKNNEITIKAEKKRSSTHRRDLFSHFYGGNSALGGSQNPTLNCGTAAVPVNCPSGTYPTIGYGGTFENTFNNNAPIRGAGVTFTVPIRNRTAQADQARSQMEYRQSQMRLQQLYTQIRIQVINGQYALTNDRAQITAAQAAYDYAAQSLVAEQARYKFGASTNLSILQQGRNLATADDTLISAKAAYARDRAALEELLSITLDRYGISIESAASGTISQAPVIPDLTGPAPPPPPKTVETLHSSCSAARDVAPAAPANSGHRRKAVHFWTLSLYWLNYPATGRINKSIGQVSPP